MSDDESVDAPADFSFDIPYEDEPNREYAPLQYITVSDIVAHLVNDKLVEPNIVETFTTVRRTNAERVRMIQKILIENDLVPEPDPIKKGFGPEAKSYKLRAQKFFQMNDHAQSLHCFNQMLCRCEYDSLPLAIGFTFRSTVYQRLGFFEACGEDVTMALMPEDLPFELTDQLQERQVYAAKKLAELVKQHEEEEEKRVQKYKGITKRPYDESDTFRFRYEPKVSHQANKVAPHVSAAVQIQNKSGIGRHVVTNRHFKPGDVLAIDEPFCHRLEKHRTVTRCMNCLKANNYRLLPCAFCTRAMYCTPECLLEARYKFHIYECPIVDFMDRALDNTELLIVRMTLKAIRMFDRFEALKRFVTIHCKSDSTVLAPLVGEEFTSDMKTLHQILRLVNNGHLRKGRDMLERVTLVALVVTMLMRHTDLRVEVQGEENESFLMDLMVRMALIADMNKQELKTVANYTYAMAIYPFAGMLNHSCAGNVDRFALQDKIVLLATRRIKSACEMNINYGYYFEKEEIASRQKRILNDFCFKCDCEACEKKYPLLENLRRSGDRAVISLEDRNALLSGDRRKALQMYRESSTKIKRFAKQFPSAQILDAQAMMRITYNLLLGNDADKYNMMHMAA